MTGVALEGGRFHTYFSVQNYSYNDQLYVNLDLDDTDSYGPETTTIYKMVDGTYRFSVHDYSNKNSNNSTLLSNSGAQVKIYKGSNLLQNFNVPSGQEGTLWTVFEMYSNGVISSINTLTYESAANSISKQNNNNNNNSDVKLISNVSKINK